MSDKLHIGKTKRKCVLCNDEDMPYDTKYKAEIEVPDEKDNYQINEVVTHLTCGGFIRNLIDKLELDLNIKTNFEVLSDS